MNNEKMQFAIHNLDEDLILEAESSCARPGRNAFRWASAAAACLVLVGGLILRPMLSRDSVSTQDPVGTQQTDGGCNEGDQISPGENAWSHYLYKMDSGDFANYTQGRVIADWYVGGRLGETTVTAGWYRNGIWENSEHARAEIYEIEGVPTSVAVALKFLDELEAQITDCYYVQINMEADHSAVEQYVIVNLPWEENDGAE